MTYQEWKTARQNEFNNLPIFFAFGKQQFKEQMEKRGLTENDTDKVYTIGFGGYYLIEDAPIIRAFMNKPDDLAERMKDYDFAVSAFVYEMGNHEYHINGQGDWDVCSCFGNCEYDYWKSGRDYLKEEGYSDEVMDAYDEARKRFYKLCNENDWW